MFLSFHSLSSFLSSRPPLAMFILSLLALSVTTLSLAIYCRSSPDLHNVDVLDWNKLFTEMSNIKFCLKTNSSSNSSSSPYFATMGKVPLDSNLVAFLPRDNEYFRYASKKGTRMLIKLTFLKLKMKITQPSPYYIRHIFQCGRDDTFNPPWTGTHK